MKRIFVLFAAAALISPGLLGCQKEAETTRKTTVSTPGGTTTTTDTHTVESTGKNPPVNANGEKAE